MKKKQIAFLFAFVTASMILTGCGAIALTDEESDLIAQYSAGALLNSSEEYEGRLTTYAVSGSAATVEATEQPVVTNAPQSTQTPASQSTEIPQTDSAEPVQTEVPQTALNDLYHIDGIDISYSSYEFCNEYPKNSKLYQILANDDEVLLVVKFKVKNNLSTKKKVNLLNRDIAYPLSADESEYKPTISVLENGGLNFLETTVASGKSETAVLVYAIPKSVKSASSLILKAQESGKESTITMK